MTQATYLMPSAISGLVAHGPFRQFFVRDIAEDSISDRQRELDVQVRSGDYFVTLATKLDHIRTSAYANEELNGLVTDLLYLQKAYKIVKK